MIQSGACLVLVPAELDGTRYFPMSKVWSEARAWASRQGGELTGAEPERVEIPWRNAVGYRFAATREVPDQGGTERATEGSAQ